MKFTNRIQNTARNPKLERSKRFERRIIETEPAESHTSRELTSFGCKFACTIRPTIRYCASAWTVASLVGIEPYEQP